MKQKPPRIEDNAYSVLKLSVARLMHIREVQATGGGHFVKVARELGYMRERPTIEQQEIEWVEAQQSQAEQVRRKRSDALVERLRAARERLGVHSIPPESAPDAGEHAALAPQLASRR